MPLQHGWSHSGSRTLLDSGLQRGRSTPATLNPPRYAASARKVPLRKPDPPRFRPPAWKVHPRALDHPCSIEPSKKSALSVDSAPPGIAPSTNQTPNVAGATPTEVVEVHIPNHNISFALHKIIAEMLMLVFTEIPALPAKHLTVNLVLQIYMSVSLLSNAVKLTTLDSDPLPTTIRGGTNAVWSFARRINPVPPSLSGRTPDLH